MLHLLVVNDTAGDAAQELLHVQMVGGGGGGDANIMSLSVPAHTDTLFGNCETLLP